MTQNFFVVMDVDTDVNASTPAMTFEFSTAKVVTSSGTVTDDTNVPQVFSNGAFNFVDNDAPQVLTLDPADDALNIDPATTFTITFNEKVVPVGTYAFDDIELFDKVGATITSWGFLVPDVPVTTDDRNFAFTSPVITTPLVDDTDYFIIFPAADVVNDIGVQDLANNPFPGILLEDDWNFETRDSQPPVFVGTQAAINITDVSFDLQVQIDEPGIMYYIVIPATVFPKPTGANLRDPIGTGYAGAVADGTINIIQGNQLHYEAIFGGLTASTAYEAYLTADDGGLNQMVDDPGPPLIPALVAVSTLTTPTGVQVTGPTGTSPYELCNGAFQPLPDITLFESANTDFTTGVGLTYVIGFPTDFEFNTTVGTATPDTPGGGAGSGDIPVPTGIALTYVNPSTLVLTYDVNTTGASDRIVISDLEVQALDTGVLTIGII